MQSTFAHGLSRLKFRQSVRFFFPFRVSRKPLWMKLGCSPQGRKQNLRQRLLQIKIMTSFSGREYQPHPTMTHCRLNGMKVFGFCDCAIRFSLSFLYSFNRFFFCFFLMCPVLETDGPSSTSRPAPFVLSSPLRLVIVSLVRGRTAGFKTLCYP